MINFPENPKHGDKYFDKDTGKTYRYDEGWKELLKVKVKCPIHSIPAVTCQYDCPFRNQCGENSQGKNGIIEAEMVDKELEYKLQTSVSVRDWETNIKATIAKQRAEFVKEIDDLVDQMMTIVALYIDAKNYNLKALYNDIKVFMDKLKTKYQKAK